MPSTQPAPTASPSERPDSGSAGVAGLPGATFAYGFRPFFLVAGLVALVYVPWWAGSIALGWQLSTSWPPTLWHAHEMLFGFIAASVAGFLLTAVPSWTGQRGFAGWPLLALVGLWLAARIAILTSAAWPPSAIATLDLAFLPALAAFLAVPLLRSRNRNSPLLLVLLALWACNTLFYWGLARHDVPLASRALRVGIDVILLLVTVIAGRILPAFTASALRSAGLAAALRVWPFATPLTIALMLATIGTDLLAVDTRIAATVAAATAVGHGLRLLQWRPLATRSQPIVWILHLAYAWLPVGFALKAGSLVAGAAGNAFWLHALTIGAISSMVLGVMTRAALGHTGRPLVVAPVIAAAYLVLSLAAAVRVFGLGLFGVNYPALILASALLWATSFALYLLVYAPILTGPRVDGRAG